MAPTAKSLPAGSKTPLARHRAIEKGLPYARLAAALDAGRLDMDDAQALIAPRRTIMRRKQAGRFTLEESDRLARVLQILDLADATFGNRDKAHRWLRTGHGSLDGHRPIDLCSTGEGTRLVEDILGRLAHGVYG